MTCTNVLISRGFLTLLMIALVACGQNESGKEGAESATEAVSNENIFEISNPELYPASPAESQLVSDVLEVNGSLAPIVNRTVGVGALAGGRVTDVYARLGDSVTQGQLLVKLNSPDLANAIALLKQARADEDLAEKAYERNKFLYDHGVIVAKKDLQVSENNLTHTKVNTENALTQVKLLNADPKNPSPYIELRSPINGLIIEQNVTPGGTAKSVDAAPNLFTIADLSKIWLLCDVYENNLQQVKVGDFAQIHVNAFPDQQFQGRVSNIFGLLDPLTRSTKVRIELDNEDGNLKPGMFATALFISQSKTPKVSLPSTAVFRLHDKDWVFSPLGGNRFIRIEIKTGETNTDGTIQIDDGIQAGEMIVNNALQLSAAARAENPVAFQDHPKPH